MVASLLLQRRRIILLSAALLSCGPAVGTAFVVVSPHSNGAGHQPSPQPQTSRSPSGASIFTIARSSSSSSSSSRRRQSAALPWAASALSARPRSVVEDPDGPTPVPQPPQPEKIDPDDVAELRDARRQDELPHPIPHQPWRRGDTAGCEAPISAEWRAAAEREIRRAVQLVGGRVLDATWFLTALLVTLDDEQLPPEDMLKDRGPQIDIRSPKAPTYRDPADPNPDPIWADDDDDGVFYERETPEERELRQQRRENMYVNKDDDDDPEEPHRVDRAGDGDDIDLWRRTESRDEVAGYVAAELSRQHRDDPQEIDDFEHSLPVDTAKLSTVAHAILQALEPHEDDWRVLQRHELILAGPNPAPDVIEMQRQFDHFRNHPVAVETVDPFESNRTIKGRLVDRNSMDVLLNVQGRLVTIPHNFVKCVRLPPGSPSVATAVAETAPWDVDDAQDDAAVQED